MQVKGWQVRILSSLYTKKKKSLAQKLIKRYRSSMVSNMEGQELSKI